MKKWEQYWLFGFLATIAGVFFTLFMVAREGTKLNISLGYLSLWAHFLYLYGTIFIATIVGSRRKAVERESGVSYEPPPSSSCEEACSFDSYFGKKVTCTEECNKMISNENYPNIPPHTHHICLKHHKVTEFMAIFGGEAEIPDHEELLQRLAKLALVPLIF